MRTKCLGTNPTYQSEPDTISINIFNNNEKIKNRRVFIINPEFPPPKLYPVRSREIEKFRHSVCERNRRHELRNETENLRKLVEFDQNENKKSFLMLLRKTTRTIKKLKSNEEALIHSKTSLQSQQRLLKYKLKKLQEQNESENVKPVISPANVSGSEQAKKLVDKSCGEKDSVKVEVEPFDNPEDNRYLLIKVHGPGGPIFESDSDDADHPITNFKTWF